VTFRFSAGGATNAAAWGLCGVLVAAAIAIANRLGFLGLLLLGGFVWFVCVRAEMNDEAPTWSTQVFRSRMDAKATPEQRAALDAARHAFVSPLRFYGRCGMVLAAIGASGLLWEMWRDGVI
jgi:hypothetical protein